MQKSILKESPLGRSVIPNWTVRLCFGWLLMDWSNAKGFMNLTVKKISSNLVFSGEKLNIGCEDIRGMLWRPFPTQKENMKRKQRIYLYIINRKI